MRKPIKHYKSASHKKSKALRFNLAVNPVVQISIIAAIALVIFAITFLALKAFKLI